MNQFYHNISLYEYRFLWNKLKNQKQTPTDEYLFFMLSFLENLSYLYFFIVASPTLQIYAFRIFLIIMH
jgi:hypothetical protein